MKIIEAEQRSNEWFKARLGIPTASCFSHIITTLGKPSTQRTKYMYKLAGERVAQSSEEGYQNAAMLRGIELEEEARKFYELTSNAQVKQVGFCLSDCGRYGASPDGLVEDKGQIEIKCPSLAVHVSYLMDGSLPSDYFQQTQGQLLVTGREWSDFISYYPGIKPLKVRVQREEKFLKCLESELNMFCDELETVIKRISQ